MLRKGGMRANSEEHALKGEGGEKRLENRRRRSAIGCIMRTGFPWLVKGLQFSRHSAVLPLHRLSAAIGALLLSCSA